MRNKRLKVLWTVIKRCHGDKVIYLFVVNVFVVAFLVMLAEPAITSYGDGLWYTLVACTTIGFGDFAAVTLLGRILTIYIAFHEILLFALLPGIMVTYYMEIIHRREQEDLMKFKAVLERLPELSKEELAEISEKVKRL